MMDKIRNGNFNSSEIVALTKDGVSAITFVTETIYERYLGQSLDSESDARALVWGKLLEPKVFDLLGLDYILTSDQTDVHPVIPYWVGSKDGYTKKSTVFDIKCPSSRKSFCQLVQPLYHGLEDMAAMDAIRNGYEYEGFKFAKHKDAEKYYWQLVSNACIGGYDYAELIVYMPYLSELEEIKLMADGNPSAYYIAMGFNESLPHILDNGYYKNINVIRFEVPQKDKDFLEKCVLKYGRFLK